MQPPQSPQPFDEEVYRGPLIRVLRRTLPAPSGGQTVFDVVEHPGSVAIVALRDDPERPNQPLVALVRQERPAINRQTVELPAGLMNPSEAGQPERTAARELREETGYTAGRLNLLTRTYSSPGFTTETISIYLATGLQPAPGQFGPQDPTEISAVVWMPLAEAVARCGRGEIDDMKTVLGLMLAQYTHTTGADAMPFSPSAPYPTSSAAAGGRDPLLNTDQSLRLESVMLEEFNYAGATAYQALEDRGRMFNFYLGIAGVLAGGLGALYGFGGRAEHSELVAAALSVLAGFIGLIFFFKIVRIRQAFSDSILTMNVIKEYYIRQFKASVPDVEKIFRWRMKTVPSARRFGSLTFLVCFAVSLIDSLAVGLAALVIGELATNDAGIDTVHLPTNSLMYVIGGAALLVALVVQTIAYLSMLRGAGQQAAIEQIATDLGIDQPSVVQE